MDEPKDRNQEIARLAVARYMADKGQVDECIHALKEGGGTAGATLAEILAQRGYITPVQRDALLSETGPPAPEAESVGGYQLIKLIGKGGMGSVYRARQVSLDRIVALKILNRQLADNSAYRERFLREARAVGGLNHPNIVRAIDAGEDRGSLYFAMELVDGRNVTAFLQEAGPFPEARAVAIIRQIGQALAHAWRHRLIHRDIKPENILIDRDGIAKLTDLGLAKSTGEERRITQAGMAMGTPYYISPEQIRLTEDLDVRADLYALGATFFHMVTGRAPYLADSSAAVVSMHVSAPVPDPRQYSPGLSAGLAAVIMKMMAKDRKDRFQVPEELVAALDALDTPTAAAYFSTGAAPGAPGAAPESQGVGFGTVMAIVSLMALAALAYFILFGGSDKGPEAGESGLPGSSSAGPEVPVPAPPEEKKAKVENPPDVPADPVRPVPSGPPEHEVMFRAAEKYIEAHPEDYAGGLARLEDVRRTHAGTTSAMLAERKAAQLRIRMGDTARGVLSDPEQGIEVRARRLLDQGKFVDGLKLFDSFPQGLRTGEWGDALEAAKARYVDEARGRIRKGLRRALELEARKKYQEALQVLSDLKAIGVPEYAGKLAAEEDRIRGLRSDRLYGEFVSSLRRGISSHGLEASEDVLKRWEADPDAEALRNDLSRAREAVADAGRAQAARDQALKEAVNQPVEIRMKDGRYLCGTLRAYSPEKASVLVKGMEGASENFKPPEIGIASLGALTGAQDAKGWRAVAALQLLALEDFEAARQALRRAEGGDPWLERAIATLQDEAAADLLGRAEKFRPSDPERAYALLVEAFELHRDSRVLETPPGRARALLEQVGQEARKGWPSLPSEVRARVAETGEGKLRLIWNFSTRGQIRDLEFRGDTLMIEDGTLYQTAKAPGCIALFPYRWGNYTFDAEVVVPPASRAGSGATPPIGFVFHHQNESEHFLFLIGPAAAGDRAEAGFYETVLERGGTVEARNFQRIEIPSFNFHMRHKLSLRVNGDSFRGLVDGVVVGQTQRPRFGAGRIGLRADCPCAFSEVRVVGKPGE